MGEIRLMVASRTRDDTTTDVSGRAARPHDSRILLCRVGHQPIAFFVAARPVLSL